MRLVGRECHLTNFCECRIVLFKQYAGFDPGLEQNLSTPRLHAHYIYKFKMLEFRIRSR